MRLHTTKELRELAFWAQEKALRECGRGTERGKRYQYAQLFGLGQFDEKTDQIPVGMWNGNVLEIGTGPLWGLLPYVAPYAHRAVAVDPLIEAFDACGLLEDRGAIHFYSEYFEYWDAGDQRFDAIICCNALDHGDLGFHLLIKIWALLKPGGKFYLHVHLRPPELVNALHDHPLTEAQLDKHLAYTTLVEEKRVVLPRDVDGWECPTLIGIWRKE